MVSRYFVRCPGCEEVFVARIGVEPTELTKFYLPCPHCNLPIRGRMTGQELEDHRVTLDGEFLTEADAPPKAPVITINPFVPSRYDADSFDGVGTFPLITLLQVLGNVKFMEFREDLGTAESTVDQMWPPTETLFEYYLSANWAMFDKTAKSKFGMKGSTSARHQRTSIAYQALGTVNVAAVGSTGERGEKLFDRYSRKHLAAIKEQAHLTLLHAREADTATLERDLFNVTGHFLDHYPLWSMGRLVRHAAPGSLNGLTLYRDEFTSTRDLYQQGFELACKCIWVLVAAQNTVKSKDPNTFIVHPTSVPANKQPRTMAQFDKLPNAYKIAYAAQVPGWDSLTTLLDNKRRNTIGHASTRHDLRTGRIVSDKESTGITYLEFLNETHGVFEALTALLQVVRSVRVVTSTT